jgi:kynureninase
MGARRSAGTFMDHANLLGALLSALVGASSLAIVMAAERPVSLSGLLAAVLLLNAVVRFQLARQH